VSFAKQTGYLIPMQQPQSYLVHKSCVCKYDFKVMVTNKHPEHHHILCYTSNILMITNLPLLLFPVLKVG